MALYVNTNVSSLNAQRNLTASSSSMATSLQRLSSGLRVNSAKDDAAGLAVAAGMTAQVRGSNQAIRNANDGISMIQTAEGALGQVETNVQRVRELAVQASNGSLSTDNRAQIQSEITALTDENKRLIDGTKFNGTSVLKQGADTTYQVGADNAGESQIKVTKVDVSSLKAYSAVDVTGADGTKALAAIADMDTDLKTIATTRATMGATQNRFEAVVANLQNYVENMSASRSRILDADFAAETANLTRNQIIQQAGTSMLQRANGLPQSALTLLQG